jgi:glyoxalase family protein
VDPRYSIQGLHHVTLVTSNAERTARFYSDILGLDFVKRTVVVGHPDHYHLFFGETPGVPGTLVSFYVWPGWPPGQVGIGSIHHLALTVPTLDGLLKWKTLLQHHHRMVAGPFDHRSYWSLVFTDPDGVLLEIATAEPGWKEMPDRWDEVIPDHARLASETWPEPVSEVEPDMRLQGLHHVSAISSDLARTNAFYEEILELPPLYRTVDPATAAVPRWYWKTAPGDAVDQPGAIVTYSAYDGPVPVVHGQVGHGLPHHLALAVGSDDAHEYWCERLTECGIRITPTLDRTYFRSRYFRDPDGVVLELVTNHPGFLVDQSADQLGKDLALPHNLEEQRDRIERELPPLHLERTDSTP